MLKNAHIFPLLRHRNSIFKKDKMALNRPALHKRFFNTTQPKTDNPALMLISLYNPCNLLIYPLRTV